VDADRFLYTLFLTGKCQRLHKIHIKNNVTYSKANCNWKKGEDENLERSSALQCVIQEHVFVEHG
jgi:hypothetical protein